MADSLDARAKGVFDGAVDLRDEERAAFLETACGQDTVLRARVEALLASDRKDDRFLGNPTMGAAGDGGAGAGGERPGMRIGPYRLVELIGEGGFGSVFLAEQEEPVRRRVALKIIKLGMDTRAVVARFEHERQALALMDHPNIAKVLGAGATEAGRPYFIMEYVKGEPITTYCDRANLNVVARLELFTQVCRAVQHAHTKGIIHRDIKPSNVLVGEQDGRAFCRVIDFGIAKATQRPTSDKMVFTELRQFIGTPEYMSPEQAGSDRDIDTRTDVYSLGVLLYELLTGATPFDPKRLRSAAFGELQRIIRETDPPAPSTKLGESKETVASVAAVRGTEPRRLGSMLRGELDWIVMRAIEKDRERRYDSPGNLAMDVERYLQGQEVQAAPPGVGYRMKKALRRHRVGIAVAGLIALSLIVGLGAAMWQANVAAGDRDRAQLSEAKAQAARNESELRRKEIEQVAAFQQSQLEGIDPEAMGKQLRDRMIASAKTGEQRQGLGATQIAEHQEQLAKMLGDANPTDVALSALDENIFARALRAADEQFKDQPLVKARLLQTLAGTLRDLGLLDRATAPQIEALAIRRRLLGNDDPATVASIASMGSLLLAQNRFAEAEVVYREALAAAPRVLGEDDRVTLGVTSDLGLVLQSQGKRKEAEPYFRDLLARFRRVLGPDAPETLQMINNMGGLMMDDGKPDAAEPFFREALDRRRKVGGENDADTLMCMNNLGLALEKQGKPGEAEPMYRDAMERSRKARGDDHPDSLLYMSNLGFVLGTLGQMSKAEELSRDALERRRAKLGGDDPDTLQSAHNLGVILLEMKRPAEAEPLLRAAMSGREHRFGTDSSPALGSRKELVRALIALGHFEQAEALLLETERRVADPKSGSVRAHTATVQRLIDLYNLWELTEPSKGHAARAAEWRAKLDAAEPSGQTPGMPKSN